MDATGGSKTEVAAKMIGAQLQSLLKIPPIKKHDVAQPSEPEHQPDVSNHREEPRKPVRPEEKENTRSFPPGYSKRMLNSDSETHVAKDRFGRPFQSLDRRGRGGRDFHYNGPGPRKMGGPGFRDREIPGAFEDFRGPDNFQSFNKDRQRGGRNAPPNKFDILPPARKVLDGPSDSPVSRPMPPPGSFHLENSFAKYDHPSRIQEQKSIDAVDPAIRQLVKKQECPQDIREKIEFFNDKGLRPNRTVLTTFQRHCVKYLERKNPKFPKAKFYCHGCNYHMDTLYATINHIIQERHLLLEKMGIIAMTINELPSPSPDHSSYLTDLLIKASKLHGMNHTERMLRIELVQKINESIKGHGLDCEAVLFGSSLSGFGFRDSNVNININVGNDASQNPSEPVTEDYVSSPKSTISSNTNTQADFSEATSKLLEIIKQLPQVSEVKEVYTPKCVSIHFKDGKSRTNCVIHFNNTLAVVAAQLFAEYDKLDPRVKPLVLCLRHWARICDLDDQEKGFLPSHCYAIMVIHYLQEVKRFPSLHLIPRIPTDRMFATAEEAQRLFPHLVENNENIGELWLGLLKYYAVSFNYKDCLISISRGDKSIPKNEKQWNRKICIEDPVIPKSNLSRSVTNNKICDYIIDRLKLVALYFGIPRKVTGPLYDGILPYSAVMEEDLSKVVLEEIKPTTSQELQRMVRQIQKQGTKDGNEEVNSLPKESQIGSIPENVVRVGKVYCGSQVENFVYVEDSKKYHDILFKKEYHYEFKQECFSDGTVAPIICKSCGADGHLKTHCPEETLPPFLPVEYPTPSTLRHLNQAVEINFDQECLDARDVEIRQRIVNEVNMVLRVLYPTVELTLFGSTFNGFGMHSSDIDICLTFTDVEVPPGERGIKLIDVSKVLENIVSELKHWGGLQDILSIPSAKVPIVKFRHARFQLEGDISLYNQLSIYNTKLLRLYVELDFRVAKLGLFLKKLVKLCDIGDASKGSLSSYSYILMLIHFLQNHSVPVLPVLQEFQVPGGKRQANGQCENHVIQFCNDLQGIKTYWEGYGKNKESPAQLWLAFLNYYVEKFDSEKHVVTISQSEPLTRATKCWYTDALAIEDPFDKTHNLGGGLTRRMSVHILRTFQRYRVFFHRSTDNIRGDISILNYYFEVKNIREGNPPIDRQCRLCCRIGHIARNCTYANKPEEIRRIDEMINMASQDAKGNEGLIETPVPAPENGTRRAAGTTLIYAFGKEDLPPNHLGPSQPQMAPWQPASPPQVPPAAVSKLTENGNISGEDVDLKKVEFLPQPEQDNAGRFVEEDLIPVGPNQPGAFITRNPVTESPQNVKEVVFFGDIGGHNPDGEQIQAMLQKNEGVTFTFDLASNNRRPSEVNNTEMIVTSEPSEHAGLNMVGSQPPPGFCPPGSIYVADGVPIHGMPFIQKPQIRPMMGPAPPHPYNMAPIGVPIAPPAAIPYGHPFQQVLSMRPVPFENRPQVNGEVSSEHVGSVTPIPVSAMAPPPGFAPLPPVSVVQPEILRTFASPYQAVPGASMYSMAPMATAFQPPPNNYGSPTIISSEDSTPIGAFRGLESSGGQPAVMRPFEGNLVSDGQNQSANLVHQSIAGLGHGHIISNFQAQPHPPIHINPVMPNGQIMNGEMGAPSGFTITTTAAGEVMFGSEYNPGAGNAPASSYGLSLSQAHHGPVVSALQMQHSQHHPMQMQGGHFHHHVRPIMAIGSPYSYPPMVTPQPHVAHLHENMIPIRGDPNVPANVLEAKYPK